MSLARSLPSRSFRQLSTPLATARSSALRRGQRLARRHYASATETAKQGAEAAKKGLSSELPWILTAIGVTIPGTYLILNGGPLHNPLSYPEPGSKHHGHHDEHDEHEEQEEDAEEEKPAEEESEEKVEESTGDEEEKPSESGDEEEKPSSGGEEGPAGGEKTEEDNEDGSKTVKYADAKGGTKRRVESGNSIKLGQEDDVQSSTDDAPDDAAAPSKEPIDGSTSGKQKGISNTDTKHSTDPGSDPGMSKKSEGAPETAKSQGTVDPSRPAQ